MVQGSGFRVLDSGFKVLGLKVPPFAFQAAKGRQGSIQRLSLFDDESFSKHEMSSKVLNIRS
jgi:hypothetical protein